MHVSSTCKSEAHAILRHTHVISTRNSAAQANQKHTQINRTHMSAAHAILQHVEIRSPQSAAMRMASHSNLQQHASSIRSNTSHLPSTTGSTTKGRTFVDDFETSTHRIGNLQTRKRSDEHRPLSRAGGHDLAELGCFAFDFAGYVTVSK